MTYEDSPLTLSRPWLGCFAAAFLPTACGLVSLNNSFFDTMNAAPSYYFYIVFSLTFALGAPIVALWSLWAVNEQKGFTYMNIVRIALKRATIVHLMFALLVWLTIAALDSHVDTVIFVVYLCVFQSFFWVVGTLPITLFCAAIFWFVAVSSKKPRLI